jgi:squalene-hopene/tetraprenyl-beta-curcumene cyclase
METASPAPISPPSLNSSVENAVDLLFRQQEADGYWFYTLEANETIGAGFIQLMHFLGDVDSGIQTGLVRRILSEQRGDGSWALFHEGPGDLSTTIECYFALRLAGRHPSEPALEKARHFILQNGGLTRARVFTRIHLALFGLIPWSACPSMPIWFILLPPWCGVSIYEFSSWARASIVPLLLVDAVKPVRRISFGLNELFLEPEGKRVFRFPAPLFSFGRLFILLDRILKLIERFPWHPGKRSSMKKAERWVRVHIARTEDIYPAMAYAAIAFKGLGYPLTDPTIQKAVNGLKRFQQKYCGRNLPESSPHLRYPSPESFRRGDGGEDPYVHQQCCISPHWDTPWAGLALIEAGVDPNDPRLLKAARYLVSKEIKDFAGDWRFKNQDGPPGGWSFEFQNDYFPDVDDTIEAIQFLRKVSLPDREKEGSIERGLAWMLSMQSKNGGWAAFDKNNLARWVNKIPFADHGACLDPPTPDITGRMIELLAEVGYPKDHPAVRRALEFLRRTQEPFGGWRGRWGVNFIYGTWCVLQGITAIVNGGRSPSGVNDEIPAQQMRGSGGERYLPLIKRAAVWLASIQNKDGGWGESCLSDSENRFVPLGLSVPSQTAWAVMALLTAGERDSIAVRRGIAWLVENQNEEGGWDEPYFTGTGFPGHFYIRYHGYRYYFPLLALGRYEKATVKVNPSSAF